MSIITMTWKLEVSALRPPHSTPLSLITQAASQGSDSGPSERGNATRTPPPLSAVATSLTPGRPSSSASTAVAPGARVGAASAMAVSCVAALTAGQDVRIAYTDASLAV